LSTAGSPRPSVNATGSSENLQAQKKLEETDRPGCLNKSRLNQPSISGKFNEEKSEMKESRLSSVAALCQIGLMVIALPAVQAWGKGSNWPQWRGPSGQGVSEEKGLPLEWSDKKNVKWKTALSGRGHSSPIVWGNRIFITTAIEGPPATGVKPPKHTFNNEEFVHPDWAEAGRSYTLKLIAVDAARGRVLWERTAYDGPITDYRHKKNTYASATPVTDGRYVYAYFGTEGLYCYDFNGRLAWKRSLGYINQLGMGAGTSPVLFDNLIILQCDQRDDGKGSFLVALDKRTGRETWRVARSHRYTWATPVIARSAGRTELITSGAESTIAYDPATGKELWRAEGVISNAIPTPVIGHNIVVVSAGSQAKRAIAIRLGGSGDLTGTQDIVWRYQKGTAYVPSPILYGDYVYLMTDAGLLTCLDVKTGEVKYEGKRVPVPAKFMASPVAFENKILITSEDGDTFVLKAGPEYEVLHTNSLGEPVYASPAIADGRIFIRGDKHLYCIATGAGK
jgi:outer membrane protein assembly factor BamB